MPFLVEMKLDFVEGRRRVKAWVPLREMLDAMFYSQLNSSITLSIFNCVVAGLQ
jgi:hypothetical protein